MALRTSTSTSTTSFLLCALLGVTLVSSNELRIHNASEFITFAKSSSTFSGTTVYLESDLDFLGENPKELGPMSYFRGTFDGQGHTISNLAIKYSSDIIGLFGYSTGTVKNLVMDSSCSVTSNFTGDNNVDISGIIGYINAENDNIFVSNIVNMADVAFEGNTTGDAGYLYFGGIVGFVTSSKSYEVAVINCVNYGSLKHSGVVSESVFIGGIVGEYSGDSSPKRLVQNCFNYGPVTITATGSGSLYAGGIVGESKNTAFTNCVSAGTITPAAIYRGGIVGYVEANTNITHCLWTSDVGCDKPYESGSPTITDSSLVAINPTTVDNLNEYASNNGWNKWLLNENNKSVSFKINSNKNGFVLSSKLILLPGIDAESDSGVEFSGWFSDPYCNDPFTSSQINEDTTLYGLYGKIISITFNPNGGTVSPNAKRVVVGGTYGTLPVPNKTGYAFLGWFTENNEIIISKTIVTSPMNHTLYAQWKANEYTVTFNVNGGDDLEEPSKAITFDAPYGELPEPRKNGYSFLGWFTENNEIITSKTIVTSPMNHTLIAQWTLSNYTVTFDFANGTKAERVFHFNETIIYPDNLVREGCMFIGWNPRPEVMPANNLTITAQWKEVTNSVEIIFGTKDLTEEKVKEIIKHYTDETFTIIGFEKKDDETRVIVKFTDKEKAEEFIRSVDEIKREEYVIKRIAPAEHNDDSFKGSVRPILLLQVLFNILI